MLLYYLIANNFLHLQLKTQNITAVMCLKLSFKQQYLYLLLRQLYNCKTIFYLENYENIGLQKTTAAVEEMRVRESRRRMVLFLWICSAAHILLALLVIKPYTHSIIINQLNTGFNAQQTYCNMLICLQTYLTKMSQTYCRAILR